MSQADFAAAHRYLNETILACEAGDLSFRVYYWGMVWDHRDNPVHRHSFYEACYVLEGEGEYEEDRETYRLTAGSLFVSIPGEWHQIRSETGLRLLYAGFELEMETPEHAEAASAYDAAMRARETPVIQDGEGASGLLWRALLRQSARQEADAGQTAALGGVLLASFPGTLGRPPVQRPSRPSGGARSSSHLTQLAKRFIRDNLSRPLKLGDIAAALHISERHLSRLFREEGDVSFVAYLRRERLYMAEMLLKTTVHPVKEIAERTGFQSLHYFTRVFADSFGMPPAEFRKRNLRGLAGADPAGRAEPTRDPFPP
ncbi:AraC family transcriptional regulator [Cohnella nanjingensis]|uniref:AraC family transcriptional regulator n=1 Tax=Cohnella nanjingensis TaxID=1387779 RepID=A0A7X0RXT2_9BACL|nr:AraC family transcriptional regulator [Cohnella nanjingensis]MBB6675617.1 AraC family transcriptional regulator [Cohnella nanjingensis]